MRSNDVAPPWRLCPHCGAHGPGIAELGWLPVGAHHPGHSHLCGPGHIYTCRYCGQAWMGSGHRRPPHPLTPGY